jgi:hypothetical protein
LRLDWDAPNGCPDRAHVLAEVERVMGPGLRDARPVEARAVVHKSVDWEVTLTTVRDGETGERLLSAPSCELLANATALALALALTTTEAPASSPPSEPATPPVEAPAPEPSPPAERPNREPDRAPGPAVSTHRFAVGGLLLLDSSALPHAAVGPHIFVGWRPSRIELELGAEYFPGQHVALADRGTARFQLLAAHSRACYALALPIVVSPCATFELGTLSASSTGPQTTSSGSLWASPGIAARARWPSAGDVAISLDTGVGYALWRPEFVIDNIRHVYQASPFTARLGLGLELHL